MGDKHTCFTAIALSDEFPTILWLYAFANIKTYHEFISKHATQAHLDAAPYYTRYLIESASEIELREPRKPLSPGT